MTPGIHNTLIDSFNSGSFGLDAQFPNEKYEPTTEKEWAKISFLSSPPVVGTIGGTGDDYMSGIMQIDLKYPLNEGIYDANQKADSIRTYYKMGKKFTYSGVTISIQSNQVSQRGEVSGWYTVTCSINYTSYIGR